MSSTENTVHDRVTSDATPTSASAPTTATTGTSSTHVPPTNTSSTTDTPTTGSTTTHNPGKTSVDTHGRLYHSDDPSTAPDATVTQKLMGDVQGAVSGTLGSMQAAIGTMFGNKHMEDAGLAKMSAEDHRLGAKHGVPPIGSGQRETAMTTGTGSDTEGTKEAGSGA